MSRTPQVSTILANWNGALFLDQALQSVVGQTFEDWVLIAVDTGSNDGSRAILESWAAVDRRIKGVFIPHRLPCPTAINLGLARAEGPLVARIESDDVWLPTRLEAQVDFLGNPASEDIGVCGSDALLVDEQGRTLGTKRYPRSHEECLDAIWYRNPFCHSSVLMRNAALRRCGGYDAAHYLVEDLELWFRMGRYGKFHNLPVPLVRYRVWQGSLTTRQLGKLAWRSRVVRLRAARELGYKMPLMARLYSLAALGVVLLPRLAARRAFEIAIRHVSGAAQPDGRPQHMRLRGCKAVTASHDST